MSERTKNNLKDQVITKIPVGGQPTKVKALEVRNLLNDLIDTLFSRARTVNDIPPDPVTGNINLVVPTPEVIVEKQLQFNTGIIVPHQQGFFGKHQLISDTLPSKISSVAYYTQVDGHPTWTHQADIATLNGWVAGAVTDIHWRLKTVPTANPAAGSGLCEIIRRTKKV